MQLICSFVFAYEKGSFSHDVAQMMSAFRVDALLIQAFKYHTICTSITIARRQNTVTFGFEPFPPVLAGFVVDLLLVVSVIIVVVVFILVVSSFIVGLLGFRESTVMI